MARLPVPQVFSGALAGFVLGVLVTLFATGVVARRSQPAAVAPSPSTQPAALTETKMYTQLQRLVSRQLGYSYPNQKKHRLISLSLQFDQSNLVAHNRGITAQTDVYRSVHIAFRLNDHPLGRSWRARAAKADVFGVMKALYTSGLPISNVKMDGYFPVGHGRRAHDEHMLTAFIDLRTALSIPWKHWSRANEARLWMRLTSKSISRRFA